ncbi:MAG: hypothetical protein KAH57_03370, partial [Thermoplasmata archaeon]|nr:hypothetical protein [Thermoplasmata archaeon]
RDASGNYAAATQVDVTIVDNDRPSFGTDESDTIGTTGEIFSFSIAVTDNIGVTGAYVEHWFGNGDHMNDTLSHSSSTNVGAGSILIPTSSLDDLHYRFHANDTADNWVTGPEVVVEVLDNDDPILKEVEIGEEAIMGSPLTFRVRVEENIEVAGVYLEYQYGTGEKTSVDMAGDGDNWTCLIQVMDSPYNIHYLIKAVDTSENEISQGGEITLLDMSAVEILDDLTPDKVEIGQDLEFSFLLSDNMGISVAYVEFGYEDETIYNMSLSDDGGDDIYSYSHTSLYRSGSLWYVIKAVDLSGNWNISSESYVILLDLNGPVPGEVTAMGIPSTGESIDVEIEWSDEISISDAWVEYWFGEGPHFNETMDQHGDDRFILTIYIPDTQDDLNLIFRSRDPSDNWAEMVGPTIQVIDNDPPLISVSD